MGEKTSSRGDVVTVPNLLSGLRLLLTPLFVYLVLARDAEVAGALVLLLAGLTDWLDGRLARRLGHDTRLGAVLDVVADRVHLVAVAFTLAAHDVVPWWLALLLPLRDLLMLALVPLLRSRGRSVLPSHLLGKVASAHLFLAFPLLLLGGATAPAGESLAVLGAVLGWAFALWGLGLHWWTGLLYGWQVRALLQQAPPVARERRRSRARATSSRRLASISAPQVPESRAAAGRRRAQ
ncbi:CDP-alcohol phosphatidyltransferase family protein [Nocardioides yefusunii]|uniref:CDP-alcohol phosphatidyltransferase family protein n=1 Tax=Nocardioides yefusunii TaxID=2500546 RepID=A0ABW1QSD6_9ACTN|nr:CDP-alcohol phosphatidyltransferase family protein [Nocardioides yefusunii]